MNQSILPSADDYGDVMGRPTPIATENVTAMMTVKQHASLSYVGDGLEEAHAALAAGRKRKAQADGVCPSSLKDFDRTTVAAYDCSATLMDPDISLVPMESARLKSLNREIMPRSVRAWTSCAAAAIVSGFKEGKWTDKSTYDFELPEGCLLAHQMAEASMDGIDLKPIKINELINSDDIGRFVTEGIKTAVSELERRCTGKVSKISTERGVRQNSSLWRRADSDDGVYGIKCKVKVLISASGHVGPIVMHFYGFKESELSKDLLSLKCLVSVLEAKSSLADWMWDMFFFQEGKHLTTRGFQ